MYLSLNIVALCALSASVLQLSAAAPERPRELLQLGSVYEAVDPIEEACKATHNITEENLSNQHASSGNPFDHPETRCYAACLLIGRKTLNEDGTLNVADLDQGLAKNIVSRDTVLAAFLSCADKPGADACERAYNTIDCISRQKAIMTMHPLSG